MTPADSAAAPPVETLPVTLPPSVSRNQRIAGLTIVLAIAFLPSVLVSIAIALGMGKDASDSLIRYRYFNGMLMELLCLALLAYVVRQNGQGPGDLGLSFRLRDFPYGMLLWICCLFCYRLAYPSILDACELMGWHRAAPYLPSLRLGLGVLTYCFITVNPMFEEMLVRAFLMSETRALTGSTAIAVAVSTVLQASYHVYQGIPYALAAAVIFLIFSLYYAHSRRILPVIVAHFIWDLWAHLSYAMAHVSRT